MIRLPMLFTLLLLTAQPTLAQETFSFQGKLTTPDGAPVTDGSYGVRFQLFDVPTGGNPLWDEAHTITATGGVFSVILGTKTTLNLDAFHNTPQLQLLIDGTALSPRTPLTAVPFAMKSYQLDEAALRAGDNVSINRLGDGTLQIGATGGGGTGGLTSVATDGTMAGNGTSSAPLGLADGSVTGAKIANGALAAGTNVTVERLADGTLEIGSMDGGGLSSVASDATLAGNGTAGSPLQVADGAVTAAKLADGAVVAGANVTVTRQAGGAFEVASVGGGLAEVASNATLTGDGTAAVPLAISVPLVLTGSGSSAVLRSDHATGSEADLAGANYGVYGEHSNGNSGFIGHTNSGVHGIGANGVSGVGSTYGIYGEHISGNNGILGGSGFGAYGESANIGVYGNSSSGHGVRGNSTSSRGVSGHSITGDGVYGSSSSGFGVYGINGSNWGGLGSDNFAGTFNGNVIVFGTLSKSGGSFKIDHPLDPAGKYLSHSFVESPDMMNVYNGNVTTDANGEATVTLPDYFEALNRDFRYQLTVIGQFAQAIVAEEVVGNQFVIRTDKPGVKVSWQVTGIRQDAWAEENRIVVEEDKPAAEHGFYLNPSVFGQPQERGVMWTKRPEAIHTILEQPLRLEEERR